MKNIIAQLRKESGISQDLLAQMVGVSRQTIISIEKGRFDPSLPLAFALAKTFGKRIEEMFQPELEE